MGATDRNLFEETQLLIGRLSRQERRKLRRWLLEEEQETGDPWAEINALRDDLHARGLTVDGDTIVQWIREDRDR